MFNSNPTWEEPATFNKISIKIFISISPINYNIRAKRMLPELMLSKIVRQISLSKMTSGIKQILNRPKNHSQNKVK